MGSYATCWLGDFSVGSSKNDIDPSLIGLFRPADKIVVTDPNARVPPQLRHWLDEREEEPEIIAVYYSTNARLLRDRLELFGYTLETSKEVFVECSREEIRRLEEMSRSSDYGALFRNEIEIRRSLSPEKWMTELAEIRALGLQRDRNASRDTLRGYMLAEDWYGYPGIDLNVMLRLAIEVAPDATEFVYDITDLVLSGYFSEDDDLVSHSLSAISEEFVSRSKIVVLTEGKTDSWVLSRSMAVLYPHLADYYSFLDFDGYRASGGVGSLVNLVKAFAGAGIVNRTIALFDNDTAASAAILALDAVSLPKHIVIQRLPVLEVLENYPTLGPTGTAYIDVNGVAASIELMFGADVLFDAEFGFVPVQWTGYEPRLRRYQGEVIGKQSLHEKYRAKLSVAEQSGALLESDDWSGIRQVLSNFFSAFHEVDRQELVALSREYAGT